ncbi:MAG: glycosyl transferase, partial [Bradyrhizobiaceae bacterium]|nr:glycosyl transferase [Bradyrhizobiaceae bacterium]
TENENDAWFVGFTNDVTVAVWVGYDNADGQRRTLGAGETGAKAAIPIFEPIIQAVWADYAPRTPLNPPSAEARRQLVDVPIDVDTGETVVSGSENAFIEHLRVGKNGQIDDTQYRLVSREEAYAYREDLQGQDESAGSYGSPYPPGSNYYNSGPIYQAPQRALGGLFGFFFGQQQPFGGPPNAPPRPRRVDPDYPSGHELY